MSETKTYPCHIIQNIKEWHNDSHSHLMSLLGMAIGAESALKMIDKPGYTKAMMVEGVKALARMWRERYAREKEQHDRRFDGSAESMEKLVEQWNAAAIAAAKETK